VAGLAFLVGPRFSLKEPAGRAVDFIAIDAVGIEVVVAPFGWFGMTLVPAEPLKLQRKDDAIDPVDRLVGRRRLRH